MPENESHSHEVGGGGPAEGEPVEPRQADSERGEQGDVTEIPLGMPVTEAELRRLKQQARRPSDRESLQQADEDENAQEV